jgi:hypothetical protein
MPSSISSSEWVGAGVLGHPVPQVPAPPSLANPDRNTARGLDRAVPAVPWLRVLAATVACLVVSIVAWEVHMRHIGLHAGDLDDGRDAWAVERRKVDAGPRDAVVIIGDSRMLFDTDLAAWQAMTGRRPIQLAMPAVNSQAFLHDLAADEHFAGLLVIGTAELSYFREGDGGSADVLAYVRSESISQRIGHRIHKAMSRSLAFLDSNYTLFDVIERREWPEREGVEGPYQDVWKLSESSDDRQTYLWDRLESDPYLLEHARRVWSAVYRGGPVAGDVVDRAIAQAKADIDRIRARGGEVVWVRPPSTGPILDKERTRFPRDKVWDRLIRETKCFGVHFEDYAEMQHYSLPDWSHLSRSSATTYTRAYVQVLLDRVAWLQSHPARDAAIP